MPVRRIAIPASARGLGTLQRADYTDAFVLATDGAPDHTAQRWAHAIFEDAPAPVRAVLRVGWLALGLKLAASSSEHGVLGWELRQRTPGHVLLGVESRIGMPAELVLERRGGELLFATLVELRNPAVRVLWAGVAPLHRLIVRQLLGRAGRAG